jgi:hypothetical protein
MTLHLRDLVPGGIKRGDYVHHLTCDETCSRCRRKLDDDEAPLIAWIGDEADDLLLYCERCLAPAAWIAEATTVPSDG